MSISMIQKVEVLAGLIATCDPEDLRRQADSFNELPAELKAIARKEPEVEAEFLAKQSALLDLADLLETARNAEIGGRAVLQVGLAEFLGVPEEEVEA